MGMHLEIMRIKKPPEDLTDNLERLTYEEAGVFENYKTPYEEYKVKIDTSSNFRLVWSNEELRPYVCKLNLPTMVPDLTRMKRDFHIPEDWPIGDSSGETLGNSYVYTFGHPFAVTSCWADGGMEFWIEWCKSIGIDDVENSYEYWESLRKSMSKKVVITQNMYKRYHRPFVLPYYCHLERVIYQFSNNYPLLRSMCDRHEYSFAGGNTDELSGYYIPLECIRPLLEYPEIIASNQKYFKPEDNVPSYVDDECICVRLSTGLYPKNYVEKCTIPQDVWRSINRKDDDSAVFLYVND